MAEEYPQIVIQASRWEKVRDVCTFLGMAVALPILIFLALLNAKNTSETVELNRETVSLADRIEGSAECRFDENAEISDINDWIDYWTAVGFRASAANDPEGVQEALDQIDHYAGLFRELIATRSSIAERCSGNVDPVGSPPSTDEVPR